MFHVALCEPCIAPNTGNIIRLAANIGYHLHLIEPLGFQLDDRKLRRAGLDYHDLATVTRHADYQQFLQAMDGARIIACTTRGSSHYDRFQYQPDDVLLFGSEPSGLADAIIQEIDPDLRIRIPMLPASRSVNLANAVAIIGYEAWRQQGFAGGR